MLCKGSIVIVIMGSAVSKIRLCAARHYQRVTVTYDTVAAELCI
jgi:hypothetical protein